MRRRGTEVAIRIGYARWRRTGLAARVGEAVRLGLETRPGAGSVTVLLTSDARLRALNATFRGRNKPTNVLSFAAGEPGYLGDVAIAYGVARAEAARGKKPLAHHAAHLALHGTLHLLGYDHETARQAKVMETLETKLLSRMGIADPYRAEAG
ncbi:MAG TPA: rRNA maturation RNase YbeY [Rhizomicrobium sp.]|nr:rRNA maturation RNase YbeY [Rhizomicrobium sp.]